MPIQSPEPTVHTSRAAETANTEPGQTNVVVLVVAPSEIDHAVLSRIFSHCRWEVCCVRSLLEAKAKLTETAAAVVLSESRLPDGDWKTLLSFLAAAQAPSRLIVTSFADDGLWSEVLSSLGGYDVLMKPFDPSEVFRVISLAWRQLADEMNRRSGTAAAAHAA